MNNISYQVVATPGTNTTIGTANQPVIIYGYNTQNPPVSFYDTASATVLINSDDPVGDVSTKIFSPGVMFPTGCYINAAANQRVTVFYQKVV